VPEDRSGDPGFVEETPPIEHDDIMKRLLAYQERLRRDLEAAGSIARPSPWATPAGAREAAATTTEDLVDVAREEPTIPEATEARVDELEGAIRQVDEMLADLRQRFQDLAVAADDRLAAIQDLLARTRRRTGSP
jgi:hypothetical protein